MSDSVVIVTLVDLEQLLNEAQLSTGGNEEILVFRREGQWSQGVIVIELRVYGVPATPKETEIDEGDCAGQKSRERQRDMQDVLPTG